MPQGRAAGKATRWCGLTGEETGDDAGAARPAESKAAKRNARMASALRANLLKRKQQKRDRAARAKAPKDPRA